ncbi:MAG: prepilin-type N-terminal cleavage/methylation domain-containing protein [Bacilli bacterium]|nr:prepilin-type N-terminal cleavage/methylation domain-containing protein [Bacilli bacterium]
MNKKGFTLIEIIAVIVIIALVTTIVILNFDNSLNKNNNKKEEAFVTDLEKAACVYIDLKDNAIFKNTCYSLGTCTVTVDQLITNGILSSDMKDPSTNQNIDKNLTVSITWDSDGTKTCTFTR